MPSAVSGQNMGGEERYVHTGASDNYTTNILINDINRSDAGSFGIAVAKVI